MDKRPERQGFCDGCDRAEIWKELCECAEERLAIMMNDGELDEQMALKYIYETYMETK